MSNDQLLFFCTVHIQIYAACRVKEIECVRKSEGNKNDPITNNFSFFFWPKSFSSSKARIQSSLSIHRYHRQEQQDRTKDAEGKQRVEEKRRRRKERYEVNKYFFFGELNFFGFFLTWVFGLSLPISNDVYSRNNIYISFVLCMCSELTKPNKCAV